MLTKMKIFLCSSIVINDDERKGVENFIHGKSHNVFRKKGIEVIPVLRGCDSQSQIELLTEVAKNMIKDCNMFFLSFFETSDTIDEAKKAFNLAFKKFIKSPTPEINVLFKTIDKTGLSNEIKRHLTRTENMIGNCSGNVIPFIPNLN